MFDSTQPDVGFAMGLGSEVVNSRLTFTVASERLAERLSGVSEVTVEELLAWACWMAMNPH